MSAYAMAGPLFPPIGASNFGKSGGGSCGGGRSTSLFNNNNNNNLPSNYAESRDESQVVGIAVKDARLDPVALTHALTRTPSPKERRKIRRTPPPSSPTTTTSTALPPLPIPVSSTTTTTTSPMKMSPPASSTVRATEKHEEAIQFDLSIRLNGQKYSATRTLASVLQLRRDLIRELRRTGGLRSTCNDVDEMIPQVPSYYGQDCSSSMTRGFTMIQALLRNYCPILEGWLRCVVDVVGPTSQTLENFLWEPKQSSNTTTATQLVFDPLVGTSLAANSTTLTTTPRQCSTPSLQSIKENDDDTLGEEDELDEKSC